VRAAIAWINDDIYSLLTKKGFWAGFFAASC